MSKIYLLCAECFASSHDDLVGVFDDEELASQEANRRNEELRQKPGFCCDDCSQPYYVSEQDVSEFDGYKPARQPDYKFKEWVIVYSVPSVGKLTVFPAECTAFEVCKVNTTEIREYGEISESS